MLAAMFSGFCGSVYGIGTDLVRRANHGAALDPAAREEDGLHRTPVIASGAFVSGNPGR